MEPFVFIPIRLIWFTVRVELTFKLKTCQITKLLNKMHWFDFGSTWQFYPKSFDSFCVFLSISLFCIRRSYLLMSWNRDWREKNLIDCLGAKKKVHGRLFLKNPVQSRDDSRARRQTYVDTIGWSRASNKAKMWGQNLALCKPVW